MQQGWVQFHEKSTGNAIGLGDYTPRVVILTYKMFIVIASQVLLKKANTNTMHSHS